MNIFFDLDGTLLDSRKRLYLLFQDLVPESTLSIDEYWELKRNKISHKDILLEKLNYTKDNLINFEGEFLKKIESPSYLQFDTLIYGAYDILNTLTCKYKLFIITARQKKENTFLQLKELDIYKYFKDILVTEHKYEKAELIRRLQFKNEDFMIGDTDYDVLTGKQLGIRTIAVCYGFLNKKKLKDCEPEFMVDNICEITAILDK